MKIARLLMQDCGTSFRHKLNWKSVSGLNWHTWDLCIEQLPIDTRDLSGTVDGEGHRSPLRSRSRNLKPLSHWTLRDNSSIKSTRSVEAYANHGVFYLRSSNTTLGYKHVGICSKDWDSKRALKYSEVKLTSLIWNRPRSRNWTSRRVINTVLRIPENPGLNLDPKTGYPVCDISCGFLSPFRQMIGYYFKLGHDPFLSHPFPVTIN